MQKQAIQFTWVSNDLHAVSDPADPTSYLYNPNIRSALQAKWGFWNRTHYINNIYVLMQIWQKVCFDQGLKGISYDTN